MNPEHIHIHVHVGPDPETQRRITRLEEQMGVLTERIDAVGASADAAIARVQEDVASLQAQIDELKQTAVTPEDLEKLNQLQAKLDALDPVKPATLPQS